MNHTRRSLLAAAGAAGLGALSGCLGSLTGGGGTDAAQAGDWYDVELTDVRSDETFTVSEFEKPVLLETFAVWCSTCLRQQEELVKFHEAVGDDVVSVTVNVDQNEDAGKVRRHLEEHGFDWRYAISPPAMTRSLVDQFGQSITVPPKAPVVLVCPDGNARRLADGVKSADTLRSEVDEGC